MCSIRPTNDPEGNKWIMQNMEDMENKVYS